MKPSDFIKKGWCRGFAATDAAGGEVSPVDATAANWDIDGAIRAAYPIDAAKQKAVSDKIKAAICTRPGLLMAYNDVHWMSAELIIEILNEVNE